MGNSQSAADFADESKYQYEAPTSNDSRSPCPALNTLANHGYIPRDGKNIRPEDLQLAMQEKLGLSWLAAKLVIHKAFKTVGKNGLLSLSDLSYHATDSIEHDGSLSRVDAALSNNQQYKFNQERFEKFLSFSKNGKFLTIDDVAAARMYFKADSEANNPQFIWNKAIEMAVWAEASVLLYIMGKDGKISLEDARSFFEKETFPPGWQKHSSLGVRDIYLISTTLKMRQTNTTRQKQMNDEESERDIFFFKLRLRVEAVSLSNVVY